MRRPLVVLAAALVAGCAAPPAPLADDQPMTLTSPAFAEGQPIPREHSCQGEDGKGVSPPLALTNIPATARSLAITVLDHFAPRGTYTHWTAWNLPSSASSLPQAIDVAALGGREGMTSKGVVGYFGPCANDRAHEYAFTAYALDALLDVPQGAPLENVTAAMQGHVLAQDTFTGTFLKAQV